MFPKKIIAILFLTIGFCFAAIAQNKQVNFVSPKYGASFDASSADLNPQFLGRPSNLAKDNILQLRWEANNEIEGAWVSINWPKPQTIKELWIIGKAKPYDIVLDPYMRTSSYLVPRKIHLTFSDGSKLAAELRLSDDYQIITLPEAKTTQTIRIQVESVWEGSGKKNTGLCKVKAFAQSHEVGFLPHFFELYDIKNDQPVQSIKLEITNLGSSVGDARLQVSDNGKEFCSIKLNEIPENSVTMQQIWLPIVYTDKKLTFSIKTKSNRFPKSRLIEVKAYNKNYFDGGTMNIMMANHNDLGWLNTQAITADYRSDVLIAPALDMMKTNPDFKYMMESVEYLKEFLVRHPAGQASRTKRRPDSANARRALHFWSKLCSEFTGACWSGKTDPPVLLRTPMAQRKHTGLRHALLHQYRRSRLLVSNATNSEKIRNRLYHSGAFTLGILLLARARRHHHPHVCI